MIDLRTTIEELPGIGPKTAVRLAKLGIESVEDLLFHLPYRYEDRTRITPIAALQPGQTAVIQGRIEETRFKPGRGQSLTCTLVDQSGQLQLTFFHYLHSLTSRLTRGTLVRCYGEPRWSQFGVSIIHPEFWVLTEDEAEAPALEQTLTGIYATTEGLKQSTLVKAVAFVLQAIKTGELVLEDSLPALDPREQHCSFSQQLIFLHQPPKSANKSQLDAGSHPYQKALAFEELLAHRLSVLTGRLQTEQLTAPVMTIASDHKQQLQATLPFTLTSAQQRVIAEIEQDLVRRSPMLRLVQGDVGSGKTLVAALVALTVMGSGYQVALMAPTELLSEQHYKNFTQWLDGLPFRTTLLSAKTRGKDKKRQLEAIDAGEIELIIGTHALFQDAVGMERLGLVIIDEQHRFGVEQRLALMNKGKERGSCPHQLVMTATPIPRTLAMTFYADLDSSVIDELPPGRSPVITSAVPQERREQVLQRIRQKCSESRQVYWVCPMIDESESIVAQSATETAEWLAAELPEYRVGLIHGRMKGEQKEQVMSEFAAADVDILVATTVIEVGVDVPNASIMIIENAERMGLAQLHQLRGRVGRGQQQSYCLLLFKSSLSAIAKERLNVMRMSNDGFEVAQKDLELRGPGEFLGKRQAGEANFRCASATDVEQFAEKLEQVSEQMLQDYPERIPNLLARWLGKKSQYVDA